MTAVGGFRDFVELLKDVLENLQPEGRPITPMFHADTGGQLTTVAVAAEHFGAKRWPDDRLVFGFIVPFIREHEPTKVAWTFTGTIRHGDDDPMDVATLVAIDREVHETWLAAVLTDPHRLAPWRSWPSNQQRGRLLTPIQEALR